MKLLNGFLLILLSFTVATCNDSEKPISHSENTPDSKIEKVKLQKLNGGDIDLTMYRDKTVFINFWATWCKPCIAEMPSIKNAMGLLKNEKIEFLFATDESAEEVERFEAVHNFGFNYVKATNMDELNIAVLPTTFIYDRNGKKVFSEMGYRKWDDKNNLDILLTFSKQ